ncbi:MAG: acetyl-CoA carboxylase, carboxyltransferase subunit beta [Candidatus Ancaeobacter aquaticus]|nr:acetyl-CoA carboxylase, carboxyltransferase subunit beta [Candidatus Ancaeobacter aquaticus]
MALFGKSKLKVAKRNIPDGVFTKCTGCHEMIYTKEIVQACKTCPKCDYHFTMTATERISLLIDEGTFHEIDTNIDSCDPLEFTGVKSYIEKIKEDKQRTGLKEAVITGQGKINGVDTMFGVTDSRFIMGSMGSVVGEKITRLIERGIEKNLPVIMVSGSGGGARMYEGCLSLMQMAKTSGALSKLSEKGLLYVSVMTNPTMAGIMASFASLGDVMIAEPGALMGFAGPRVIKQTINQDLPAGFQTSEFMLEKGFLDMIIHRKELKSQLESLLLFFNKNNGSYQNKLNTNI